MVIYIPERVYQRILTWSDRDKVTGCLVSRYSIGSHGYAQIGWNEQGERFVTLCHRALWIHERGQIPEGMTVDHVTCHNRKCVEIAHLRLLSNFENARRTNGRDWPLGFCAQGHPDSELRWWSGRWRCRICQTTAIYNSPSHTAKRKARATARARA